MVNKYTFKRKQLLQFSFLPQWGSILKDTNLQPQELTSFLRVSPIRTGFVVHGSKRKINKVISFCENGGQKWRCIHAPKLEVNHRVISVDVPVKK